MVTTLVADVETVAIDRGTFLHAMPICATLEIILQRPVRMITRSDNEAAITAGLKGYSRKLAYPKKYHKISLSAIRDVYVGQQEHEEVGEPSMNHLGKIDTSKNRSDLGSKALDHTRHWNLVNRLQTQSLENMRALL